MTELPPLDLPESPRLVQNILWFSRALRRAGLPIGPGRVMGAIRAVEAAGFTERRDFYWTLHASFVTRPEHRAVFAQVFRLYWRDPRYLEKMMAMMLPSVRGVQEERAAKPAEMRAAQALLDGALPDQMPPQDEEGGEIEIDASATASAEERLRTLDFEQMSVDEAAEARAMLARLTLPVPPLLTRRLAPAPRGRVDSRRTLRAALRTGGVPVSLPRRAPGTRWPSLVALCDISGSMSQYSRMVLHFLHSVANQRGQGWAEVHAFTFGTRLTNITRHLAQRDVDAALAAAGAEAQDWEGGTRIGACLRSFNRDWARRVLGQGAVVLLITDGLERGDAAALGRETERLQLSARHLLWLNPLLRYGGFAPRAAGIAAMLPHVDSFRPAHNVQSLAALAEALGAPADGGERDRLLAQLRT